MKIGIVFGCFIPLHTGHMSLIEQSFAENDKTIIAVCGRTSDRGKDFIPFEDRIKLIKQKYNIPNVIISVIDDDKIFMDGTFTLENWIRWGKELFDSAKISPDKYDYTWYTGEPSYKEKLQIVYPNHKFILVDRNINTISGTKIRNNPLEYKDLIAPEFLEYLKQKGIINYEA